MTKVGRERSHARPCVGEGRAAFVTLFLLSFLCGFEDLVDDIIIACRCHLIDCCNTYAGPGVAEPCALFALVDL